MMSVSIPQSILDFENSLNIKSNFVEPIKNIIKISFINFDSFSDPLYDLVTTLSTSIDTASTIAIDAISFPNIKEHNDVIDAQFYKFVQVIQQKKMNELWDNDEDEEWEYV